MNTNPRLPDDSISSEPVAKPSLIQSGAPVPVAAETQLQSTRMQPGSWNLWFHRLALGLFVLLCAVLGVWLTLLPWSLQWTDNPLLWTHPDLRAFLSYGFVRGICSGMGILDLWIGIREASHYSDRAGSRR